MDLFRLTLTTLLARKSWVVVMVAAILVPITFPLFVPYEGNAKLLQPARAQAAWSVAWIIGFSWASAQAARLGSRNSRLGVGAYLRSQGVGSLSQIMGIWGAIVAFMMPVIIIAVGICLLFAMPSDHWEAGMWIAVNLQFAVLYFMTIGPLMLLAVALGSRFGSMVGYVLPASLCLYGLYGVGYLGEIVKMRNNALLEWVFAVSPQYWLADLTPRLIFKMGHFTSGQFLQILGYFCVLAIVTSLAAIFIFRTDPLRN